MKIARIFSVMVLAAVATVAGQAAADNCKSPDVKVVNDRTSAIEVTKIQYLDGCQGKWRTENVQKKEIPAGYFMYFHDDLEHVEGCAIRKFRLFRAHRNPTGTAYDAPTWGPELTPDEGSSKACTSTQRYTIHAN